MAPPAAALKADYGRDYFAIDESPRYMQAGYMPVRNNRSGIPAGTYEVILNSDRATRSVLSELPYMSLFLSNRHFICVDYFCFSKVLQSVEVGMATFNAEFNDLRAIADDECILRYFERDGIKVFFNLFFDGDEDNVAQVNVWINQKFYSYDGTVAGALGYFSKVLKKESDGELPR